MTRPWDRQAPAERDYFDRLGDGLVVALPGAPGGPPRGGQPTFPHGGAWLHVGVDGTVQAFTGKVEVGQGTRHALALLVADALGARLADVRVVAGDTDVTPWDIGTFGSRSMPDAAPRLRAVAAAARAVLVAAAADHLECGVGDVEVVDGRVQLRGGGRSVGYGDLVRGWRRLEVIAPGAPLPPTPVRAAPDPSAIEAVTGARKFTADLARPGMLRGKVLRPPAFGATLRTVDVSAARARPGVTVVHDGDFVGVAAPTIPAAMAAVAAIRAEWDLAPQPSERDAEAWLRAHPTDGEGWMGPTHHEVGDVDAALAAAPLRRDATYTSAYLAHVPLECRAAVAEWDGDRLTVWTGTQQPFGVREELAEALGVPEDDVRVIVPPTGAGFGGKHASDVALEAARLARAAGRPVRVAWSREEELTWAYFRPMAVIDVRAGAAADGALAAWHFVDVNAGSAAIMTPYEVPAQRVDHQPAASPLAQGPYRALAATANVFARESHVDELAAAAGVDPFDYRLRHLRDDRLVAVLRAAAERAGWATRACERGRGLGLACAVEKGGRVATVADVRVADDGRLTVVRLVTAFECGAVVDADNLRNQIEGATVMGLGGALFEAIHFEGGRIVNASLAAYRVPRFRDVPAIDVVLIDRPDLPSAGGGETPIVGVAPAIANAIAAAVGVRLRALPLVPEGVVPGATAGG